MQHGILHKNFGMFLCILHKENLGLDLPTVWIKAKLGPALATSGQGRADALDI
jgi:hypothetical protein